ncbi:hypothetical protein GQ600_11219 [Phytophthora cactorum]|nr:hypothetical protein GQ600_11219 [Phytophthora cactorum]
MKRILQFMRKKTVTKLKEARRGPTTVESRLVRATRRRSTWTTTSWRRLSRSKLVRCGDSSMNSPNAAGGGDPQHQRRAVQAVQLHDHDVFGHSTWDQVRVIIVNKDFGEISLPQAAFPHARILLCVFHMVKCLRSGMAKRQYNIQDRDKVEGAVHMMFNATAEVDYDIIRMYLYYVADGKQIAQDEDVPEVTHPFLQYFHETCATAGRFGVALTVLEATWGHLKDVLKPAMTLDACADTPQFLQSIAEMEYAKKMTDIGHMLYAGADSELHKLAKETYHCSCIFMRTELLPYRRAIYRRLPAGKSPIPINHINPRWNLSCPMNIPDEEDAEDGAAASGSFRARDSAMESARHKLLNGTNKFRTSHAVATRIAYTMRRNGTPVFIQMLKGLKRFRSHLDRRRGTFRITSLCMARKTFRVGPALAIL